VYTNRVYVIGESITHAWHRRTRHRDVVQRLLLLRTFGSF